jgi:hypothetical protein
MNRPLGMNGIYGQLFCKKLIDVGESLELQSIACGIEEKHGSLLADLALEADVWFDDEANVCATESIGQSLLSVHCEDDTKVRNRDIVAVYGIVVLVGEIRTDLQVCDDLMAEEIEVYPLSGTAAFGTTQYSPVEVASSV